MLQVIIESNFKVPVLVGSNSGEGILNSGEYILKPDLLAEEYADPDYWDQEKGPYYIFDRYIFSKKILMIRFSLILKNS